ncbi:MAG: RluA family pseudouridine synthase [SAR324 cluster bacterium]|nr:RluA family pseudouridine synthase [SAR324 cluster bacterium]
MSSSKSTSSDEAAAGGTSCYTVDAPSAGTRLDRLLGGLPGIASRQMARRLILQGAVTLNGREGDPSARLKAGDRIAYRLPPPEPSPLTPEKVPLRVLFEDSALIVLDKPAGVAMHPGPGHRQGTLVNFLLAHCGDLSGIGGVLRPGIVHRLDMDTSGVVVAAKHDAAHRRLAAQFKAHSVHRQYEGLVLGKVPGKNGTIDLPLARMRSNRFKRAVVEGGSRAVTHWRVLRRWGAITHIALRLETGRTHQIRVHLSHQGWPVLGDKLYGLNRQRGLGLDAELVELLEGLGRQALHAAELGFEHPESGEALLFSTPPPRDMAEVMEGLASRFGGG